MALTPGAGEAGRIVTLDVIRGVAVMGIFSVNVIGFAMIEAAYLNPAAYGGHGGADLALWAANMALIDGKMRTLFSMLFGASMLLVIERAETSGELALEVHLRRMIVLLGFGLAHYFLLWFGDILVLYALSGAIALAFRNRSPRRLLIEASVLTLIGLVDFGTYVAQQHAADLAAHLPHASAAAIADWNYGLGTFYPSPAVVAQDLALHRGGWPGLVTHMVSGWFGQLPATISFIPESVGLMMFGMAGHKSGFLTGQWPDSAYRRFALATVPLGLAVFGILIWADIASGFDVITLFGGFVVAVTPFRIAMAAGYAALIILAARRHGWLAQRLAATGRMAFSNYLGTSLIAAFTFYGWGLGLYGQLSRAQAWLLVPLVWLLMLAWSKPWLDRFRHGPLEWLWRSLSRGTLQPMRKP